MSRHDVIVIGGGVAGAAAALACARAGLDVALVERGPAPAAPADTDPRVYAISPGSQRFLAQLGAWDRVEAKRAGPYARMQVWQDDPARALEFDAAELGAPLLGHIVEESALRQALWSRLGSVRVHAGATVERIELGGARPRVVLADGTPLEAEVLVAAEGADSRLRAEAGFESGGWDYRQRALVCHLETAIPHRGTAFQRFLPDGPLAFLPLADGRCSIVWSTASAQADELLTLDPAAFARRLEEASQGVLGAIGPMTARRAFPLRLQHAREYAREGVALLGDSAHVIHPLAGQGVNLGLADAEALAETLAGAKKSRRPLGRLRILKTYERRRLAANLEMLALTDGLARLFTLRTPGLAGLLGWGLGVVNRAGPLRQALARRALAG